MRFYQQQHRFYCGIDLHARSMYLCILDQAGAILFHQNLPTSPDAFRQAIAPFRDGLVVAFGDAREEAVKKDLQSLQGKWQMQSSERDGMKAPDEFVKTFQRTVKDDTYVVTYEDGEGAHTLSGKMTLDPTKTPKWLDAQMTDGAMKGKTMVAIYKLEGDMQTLCVALPGKDRPTAFDSSQGTLLVWKRESKAAKTDGR